MVRKGNILNAPYTRNYSANKNEFEGRYSAKASGGESE